MVRFIVHHRDLILGTLSCLDRFIFEGHLPISRPMRKEELARQIAERDGVQRGLICVFDALEPVQAFRLAYGEGRQRLASDWLKCLAHCFYLLDPEFCFMHVLHPLDVCSASGWRSH